MKTDGEGFIVKRKKSPKLKVSKETREERKSRVSSGIKYRSSVFDDKRRKKQEQQMKEQLRNFDDE
jgi:hypothetical protein